MARSRGASPSGTAERLFVSLAEELKLPLLQIARQAELGRATGQDSAAGFEHIQTTADATLQLIDGYLLGLRLHAEPDERFALTPVSISGVLHDTQAKLAKIAETYGVTLELNVQGRYGPVMVHPLALQTALVNLGLSLIEAMPAMNSGQLCLHLAAHRTRYGIVAGMYCEVEDLTPEVWRRAQSLQGQARQALVSVSPGSGAGVLVADAILAAMSSRLRVGRFQKQAGFAVTLPPSRQLAFV
jgi:hypothetical protein